MKTRKPLLIALVVALFSPALSHSAERPPNVIYILVDDLGYGDWKVYLEKGKKMELFNLVNDPYEGSNNAASHLEIVAEMAAIIKKSRTPLYSQP